MGILSTLARKHLKRSDFALPKKRAYPIDTLARARNALARAAQFATPAEQKKIRAAVKRRWPQIHQG